MPVIKVRDLAYGRLRAPDLGVAEEFLTHFGMTRAARTPRALYMRGSDPSHHIHVTELGEPKFLGLGFHARSEEDLERLSRVEGASPVEKLDEPGGGKRVIVREPNGYPIEVVHGIAAAPPLPVARQHMNTGREPLRRAGETLRLSPSPISVKRIGHGVLGTPKVRETVQWFRDTLGLICSDDLYDGDKNNLIGSFNRCDCGDEFVDHHTLFCVMNGRAGLNHLSFEVPDVDAVFQDHQYLKKLGKYEHVWGIGRHLLGSQVYDYWADPWGRVHEHWADSDRLNARTPGNLMAAAEGLVSQWGEDPPAKFIGHVSP